MTCCKRCVRKGLHLDFAVSGDVRDVGDEGPSQPADAPGNSAPGAVGARQDIVDEPAWDPDHCRASHGLVWR